MNATGLHFILGEGFGDMFWLLANYADGLYGANWSYFLAIDMIYSLSYMDWIIKTSLDKPNLMNIVMEWSS